MGNTFAAKSIGVGTIVEIWTKIYSILGMEAEYVEWVKNHPAEEKDGFWIVPVLKGVTCNKAGAALRKLGMSFYFGVWCEGDLDGRYPNNDRCPNRDGDYQVEFRRSWRGQDFVSYLDYEWRHNHPIVAITLLERILLEAFNHLYTQHLITTDKTVTCNDIWGFLGPATCLGTRMRCGMVPNVHHLHDWDCIAVGEVNPYHTNMYTYFVVTTEKAA